MKNDAGAFQNEETEPTGRAKVHQMVSKGSQKEVKSESRGDQNASKNRLSEKVAQKDAKRGLPGFRDHPFWEPFSIKNTSKNRSHFAVA